MNKQTNFSNKTIFNLFIFVVLLFTTAAAGNAATRTWDGGGATNNWSDAANWSENTAPAAGDSVLFDATSSKNLTIDTSVSVVYFAVQSGYAGTITQASGVSVTISADFNLAAGTYVGSDGNFTMNAMYLQGGNFQGGTGLIYGNPFGYGIQQSAGTFSSSGNVEVFLFSLYGGTFNAPAGTLTVIADFTIAAGATFNAGSGTVKFTGYSVYNCANFMTINVDTAQNFNNLQFANQACNTRYIAGGDTLIVNGDLRLSNGSVNSGRIRPLGSITIEASFNAYPGSTIVELLTPNKNFVLDNPSSPASMLPVEMSAATSTLTSSGSGKLNFYGMTLTAGTLNQPNAIWDFAAYPGYAQSGGTFNGSAAQLNIYNGINGNILTGGAFNGGTGLINGGWGQTGGTFSTLGNMNVAQFTLSGGTFNAPAGILDVFSGFTHTAGGTFNAGTGTVQTSVIAGVYGLGFDVNSSEIFYNLKFNGTYNSANHGIAAGDTLIVNGTLTFNGRGVNGGSIVANGNVSHTNYGAYRNGTTLVKFEDTATRTVTLCGDAGSCAGSPEFDTQPMLVNNPNITINAGLTANGSMIVPALTLQQGTFNQGAGRVAMTTFNQSGGTYNGGTFAEAFGSLNSFTYFTLTGGDFNAAPSMSLTGNFTHTTAAGNFNEGTGTVYFYSTFFGTNGTIDVAGNETFYNVAFFSGNGTNIAAGDTLTVNGTTTLRGGTLNGGTIDQKGSNVLVSQAIVGGSFQGGTTNVIFSGAANQTFTNLDSRPAFGGTWTVNKPNSAPLANNGFAPAATTNLLVAGAIGAGSYVPLSIVSGNVVETGSYDLYLSSLSIAAGASLVNEFGGTLALAGNLTNDGTLHFNGSGAGCPQADALVVRSSVAGTQRQWSGAGIYRLIDVDLKDQNSVGGVINVYSGTDSGNNTNFVFSGGCLAPTAANVSVGGRVLNASGGGIRGVRVVLTDAQGASRAAVTNQFGFYSFDEIAAGQTVVVSVSSRKYVFAAETQLLNVFENLSEVNFTAEER